MIVYELEMIGRDKDGLMIYPYFNKEIGVIADPETSDEYIEKCAHTLATLNDDVVEKLCEFTIRYCESMRIYFADEKIDIPEMIKGREILKYISPNQLLIDKPEGEEIAFRVELSCDWEDEHGLEWSIRNGEVLYVGAYCEENPWREKEYFKNASWNFAIIGD